MQDQLQSSKSCGFAQPSPHAPPRTPSFGTTSSQGYSSSQINVGSSHAAPSNVVGFAQAPQAFVPADVQQQQQQQQMQQRWSPLLGAQNVQAFGSSSFHSLQQQQQQQQEQQEQQRLNLPPLVQDLFSAEQQQQQQQQQQQLRFRHLGTLHDLLRKQNQVC